MESRQYRLARLLFRGFRRWRSHQAQSRSHRHRDDNAWFTPLTQNTAPLHFDTNYASNTEFKVPLVNFCFTIALVTGESVADISQNVFANLGWDDVRLPHPLFEGDTVYSESRIVDVRESKSRPAVGVVRVGRGVFANDEISI